MTTTVAPRKSLAPWIKDSVQYYDHQIVGIRWMARRRNFICSDDMGLGKSIQAITVFAMDVFTGIGDTAIVVCPVSLKTNWADEFAKFTEIPHVVFGVGPDYRRPGGTRKLTKSERIIQFLEYQAMPGPKVLIANYEQIRDHPELFEKEEFHMRIFDEAHYLQNRQAKRTKACVKLQATRTVLLTGTPMLGMVDGLWQLLNMVHPRRFNNFWAFVNRYAVYGGYEGKTIVGTKNEAELKDELDGFMIRRLKEEVLNMDEVSYVPRLVDMHPKQWELYSQITEDEQYFLPNVKDPVAVDNALTQFLRLRQICATTATILGIEEDHSYKLDLVTDDALNLVGNGERVVQFTKFRPVIEAMRRRLGKHGVLTWELHGGVPTNMRQDVVNQWSSSSHPGVIICQIDVAGIGLNMTAASNAQFIDKDVAPGINKQAIDRLNRIGQTRPVTAFEYLVRGSKEQRVNEILRQKARVQSIIEQEDYKRKLLELLMAKGKTTV